MVDGQRHVRGQRLADRLAVVPGLGDGEQFQVVLDRVGDLVQDVRAISVKVSPVTGVGFSKYPPLAGGTHSPPMKWS
jgi:hypothetical protein